MKKKGAHFKAIILWRREELAMFRTIIVILAAIILIATPVLADNLSAAKKFMGKGQYPQAEAVFQALVEKDGQNADSYYWWGVCRLKQGRVADQLFLKAIGLKPAYNESIGKLYQREAEAFLRKGQADTARNLFDSAVSWDKALKPVIGQYLFNLGQYDLAIRYAPELGNKAADIFYAKAEALDGANRLPYYRQAKKFSAKYNEAIKAKLLAIAKTKFEEKDIEFWREAAAEFGKIPPDFKIYEPGTYTFSLKAGKKTDHWIRQSPEVTGYGVSSQDDKFQLIFDDGEVVSAWTPGQWPKNKYKFKIIAVTDQPKIIMVLEGKEKSGVALKSQ